MLVHWTRRRAYAELDASEPAHVPLGVLAGLAVGVLWVPLSTAVPSIGETARTGLDPHGSALFVFLRIFDMVVVVPFAEELMVRSAVPRFADAQGNEDWRARPVGAFTVVSLVASVGFFTLTHPEWLAAFATAVLWTAVLWKTRNLRPLVVAHAVANAWLAGHVLVTGESQWW
jgi:CAAX prenyl protease-like protein